MEANWIALRSLHTKSRLCHDLRIDLKWLDLCSFNDWLGLKGIVYLGLKVKRVGSYFGVIWQKITFSSFNFKPLQLFWDICGKMPAFSQADWSHNSQLDLIGYGFFYSLGFIGFELAIVALVCCSNTTTEGIKLLFMPIFSVNRGNCFPSQLLAYNLLHWDGVSFVCVCSNKPKQFVSRIDIYRCNCRYWTLSMLCL